MIYCIYSKSTGVIRARFDTSPNDAPAQIQEGEAVYEGNADPRRHVVDVSTGQLVDLRTQDPGDGSEWSDHEEAWIAPSESKLRRDREIKAEIVRLELQNLRPLRELVIHPNDSVASERLAQTDAAIAKLREKLA